jgi:hypothetical protein
VRTIVYSSSLTSYSSMFELFIWNLSVHTVASIVNFGSFSLRQCSLDMSKLRLNVTFDPWIKAPRRSYWRQFEYIFEWYLPSLCRQRLANLWQIYTSKRVTLTTPQNSNTITSSFSYLEIGTGHCSLSSEERKTPTSNRISTSSSAEPHHN